MKLTADQKKDFKRIAEIQSEDAEKKGLLAKNKTFLDDTVYHFVNGIGTPKREDGQNMSQVFLASLPKEWTKTKFEANLAHVSDADLEKKGLYRPAKNSWEVV